MTAYQLGIAIFFVAIAAVNTALVYMMESKLTVKVDPIPIGIFALVGFALVPLMIAATIVGISMRKRIPPRRVEPIGRHRPVASKKKH
jgi:uncharacterized membrane protein YfcA